MLTRQKTGQKFIFVVNQGYFRSDVEAVSTDESTSTQVDESPNEETTTENILTEAEQLANQVKAANEAKQKEIDLQTQAEYEAELAAAREKVLSFGNGEYEEKINYLKSFIVNGISFSKKDWDNSTVKMKNIRKRVVEFSEKFGIDPKILALIIHGENSNASYDGQNIKTLLQKLEYYRDLFLGKSYGIVNLRPENRKYAIQKFSDSQKKFYNNLINSYEKDLFIASFYIRQKQSLFFSENKIL